MSIKDRATRVDRRKFVGLSAASLAATLVPLPTVLKAAPSIEPPTQTGLLSDWSIDDVWGVYPRYSEVIGHGRPENSESASIRGADAIFAEFV